MGIKGDIVDMKTLRFELGENVEVARVDHRLFGCRGKIVKRYVSASYLVRFPLDGDVIILDAELKGV